MTATGPRIDLCVDRCRATGGIQVSVMEIDADGGGTGYRIAGPKYMANSESLLVHTLSERDIVEIQGYLNRANATDQAGER